MSTEYTTRPAVPYAELLARSGIVAKEPAEGFMGVPHALLERGESCVTVFRQADGAAGFTRYGNGIVDEVFWQIERVLGVQVYSEKGCPWTEDP